MSNAFSSRFLDGDECSQTAHRKPDRVSFDPTCADRAGIDDQAPSGKGPRQTESACYAEGERCDGTAECACDTEEMMAASLMLLRFRRPAAVLVDPLDCFQVPQSRGQDEDCAGGIPEIAKSGEDQERGDPYQKPHTGQRQRAIGQAVEGELDPPGAGDDDWLFLGRLAHDRDVGNSMKETMLTDGSAAAGGCGPGQAGRGLAQVANGGLELPSPDGWRLVWVAAATARPRLPALQARFVLSRFGMDLVSVDKQPVLELGGIGTGCLDRFFALDLFEQGAGARGRVLTAARVLAPSRRIRPTSITAGGRR